MSTPDSQLDKHLRALFGALDTAADFDARLMARLRVESQTVATERAMQARQQERARYRKAVLDLQSRRRSMLSLLTLDILGVAALLVVAVATAWSHLGPDLMDLSRRYGPYMTMLLSILIAGVPLLIMWAEQARRPSRLL